MHPCKNVADCERVMDRGWKNRSVGATLMNADSSRSHSIFTIHLERSDTNDDGEEHIRVAKLNLVDLAGSERQAKTGWSFVIFVISNCLLAILCFTLLFIQCVTGTVSKSGALQN